MNVVNYPTYWTIFLLGGCIYLLRVSGYWLAGRYHMSQSMCTWLSYIPGAMMVSIVAPILLTAHYSWMVASLIVVVVMRVTGNIFLSMLLGIFVVVIMA